MKIVFALLMIVFLIFSGYHVTFRRLRLPYFARFFYVTGIEFIFVGLLLGPSFLNILDHSTQKELAPIITLVLGWVGHLFGFQFDLRQMRRFPLEYYSVALLEVLITFLVIFAGGFLICTTLTQLDLYAKITVMVVLASAAVCTSPTGLTLQAAKASVKNKKMLNLLLFMSSVDGFLALLVFGFGFLFLPYFFSVGYLPHSIGRHLGFGVLTCGGLILLYLFLCNYRRKESELILIVSSMSIIASGLAYLMGLSPLLVNFFISLVLANFSPERERILNILATVEKPFYLLVLLFLGINLKVDSFYILALAIFYFGIRLLGKYLGGWAVYPFKDRLHIKVDSIGLGLLDFGGLPLAMLLDFQHGFYSDMVLKIVSIALVAIILNDMLSIFFHRKMLE